MRGVHRDARPHPVEVSGELAAQGSVTVRVRHEVVLPILGGIFDRVRPRIPVDATHVEVVDRFRELG